ncbi:TPA: hypothetical protein DCG86_03340 [Candidatus Marinimicrobia bacterium]|nr:MAG: hypothetical protein XD77_0727 [Marinimicrobia bacterium 46_47]HAE87039.1 hypothetical protein [Candidatus Neomarinimicrobiota bacterium]HBY19112.1 hypothetical protein [Candidatus Neomarinimicrobiota bacterium]
MGSPDCCHSETEFLKLEENFLTSVAETNLNPINIFIQFFIPEISPIHDAPKFYQYVYSHSGLLPGTNSTKLSLYQSYLC